MKKLTKVLSLVLVMAMMFSLCVVGASAKSFTDDASITADYSKAVDVMSSIGIIDGMGDGNFAPNGNFTRAQAAKIIAYMQLGASTASALKGSAASFSDVPASYWGAPYINYCASQGVINGYGNGKFGPEDTLTGYQFAKMLLCSVGYGVNGEYTGDGWQIAVAKDALTKGVYANVLSASTDSVITREQATQMAFNTLSDVVVVTYSSLYGDYIAAASTANGVTNGYTLAEKVYNLYRTENVTLATVSDKTPVADGYISIPTSTKIADLDGNNIVVASGPVYAITSADLKLPLDIDLIGRTGYVYVQKDNTVPAGYVMVSDFYTADVLVATKTDGKGLTGDNSWCDATYTNKNYVGTLDTGTNLKVYVNGVVEATPGTYQAAAAKVGAVVEFYNTDSDAAIDVVNIKNYSVVAVSAVTTSKDATTGHTLYTATTPSLTAVDERLIDGVENLVKGNIVLASSFGGVLTVVDAADFTGTMSQYNDNAQTMVIDGTTYTRSGNAALTMAQLEAFAGKAGTIFYKDANGYIVYAYTDTAIPTNFAYIADFGNVNTVGTASYAAQLVFADATSKVVTVKKVFAALDAASDTAYADDDINNDTCLYTVNDDGSYNLYLISDSAKDNGNYSYLASAYKVDGTAALTAIPTGGITAGKAAYMSGRMATEDTIFVVNDVTNKVLTVYKGISNVPSIAVNAASKYTAVLMGKATQTPTIDAFVYIQAPAAAINTSASVTQLAFIYDTHSTTVMKDATTVAYYEYPAIIDGQQTTLKVASTANSVVTAGGVALYSVATATDSVVTSFTGDAKVSATTTSKTATYTSGVVVINSVGYTVADGAPVYVISKSAGTVVTTDVTALDGATTFAEVYVVNPTTGTNKTTTIAALYLTVA